MTMANPMASQAEPSAMPRTPLSKERVLQAAVSLADAGGIESLSMRKLAQELGVEAMSLYNHVRNKDDVLDGIADVVIGEIDIAASGADWQTAMRRQVLSARTVLLRHRWARRVIESRTGMSPAIMRYFESVLRIFREGGFSVDQTHHALHVMGSHVLGFTQELFDDSPGLESSPEAAAILAREMANEYPYITEMALAVSHGEGLGGCDDDLEFELALDLILGGLQKLQDMDASGERIEHRPAHAKEPPSVNDVDPLLSQAIGDLRSAATHVLDVLDSQREGPQQRAAPVTRGRRPRAPG